MRLIKTLSRLPTRLALWYLKRSMRTDQDLAETWRASIRSVVYPAVNTRASSEEITHRLMKRLFQVERPRNWLPEPPAPRPGPQRGATFLPPKAL